ncbi:hypothetical protein [Luteimonas abyssi]|uniref:hypothetical protein n=1 Tax=Luteimonas abyssi TaxID=1247514 RepID=UPI000737C529|nr:hypothetical protein [Luteimonas abyssi]
MRHPDSIAARAPWSARAWACALATTTLVAASPLMAQDFTLGAGFTPDPQTAGGLTGGTGQASRFGQQCTGSISGTPDHRIRVTSALGLRLSVSSDTDSTLVLVGPSGVFCDDDGAGQLDARIDAQLIPGDYQVYVGHIGRQGNYRLSLTELVGGAGAAGGGGDNGARYRDFSLGAGFMPDPQTATGATGGGTQASRFGSHCVGAIDSTPDHRLTITSTVTLDIRVDSTTDSSLVIVGPGKVLCDDDGGQMLDARITDVFRPGAYEIYVGHLGSVGEYTLSITEGDGR